MQKKDNPASAATLDGAADQAASGSDLSLNGRGFKAPVACDTSEAADFLKQLRPDGPWLLTAIIPDGVTETITARDTNEVDAFVSANNGKRNLYFGVNPTRQPMKKKPAKVDVGIIEYIFADLDPEAAESPEAAKERYLQAIDAHKPSPTAIIDSGNGIQGLWRLSERIDIGRFAPVKDKKDELVLATQAAAIAADVEDRTKTLMETLGAVAGTQNIDRLLRLPGTINLPNKN
jgi:hypothetical protein